MKNLTLIFTSLIFLVILSSNSGCETAPTKPSADQVTQKRTEQAMQEANRQVGMPAISRFQEKKIMKMIYELRDQENYICYAYLVNVMDGSIGQYLGKCIGYGLPYSTQFSNPMRVVDVEREYGINKYESAGEIQTMPQPEPNGLFMPEGLAATWLLMIDPKTNEPRPVYIEPEIIVSPFKLK